MPPKKDFFKIVDNQQRILRFKAILNNNIPEDQGRMFIINFYLSDDSIQIFELPTKNSGTT